MGIEDCFRRSMVKKDFYQYVSAIFEENIFHRFLISGRPKKVWVNEFVEFF